LINLLKLLSRTNVKEILLDLVQMIAITSLPLFHKISYFSSLIIFKRVQIFLIVLKKKRKMKTMIRIKAISSVIKTRYSNNIESQTIKKRVRKRLIKKLKKQNLCILKSLAKILLTRQVIPKNKEAVITHRLYILSIAEKT
jgi:hypothetical protein